MMKRADILKYVKQKYDTTPEYLWEDSPEIAVFRHINGQKWYGIILSPEKKALGIDAPGKIDVINLKLDPIWVCELKERQGAFPAYHMNKTHWISIALDGSFPANELKELIDVSYNITAPKKSKK